MNYNKKNEITGMYNKILISKGENNKIIGTLICNHLKH